MTHRYEPSLQMPRADPEEASAPPAADQLSTCAQAATAPSRVSVGAEEVSAWLTTHGLDAYTPTFLAAGYNRLVHLRGMDDAEIKDVVAENKMPRPHARTFQTALSDLRGFQHPLPGTEAAGIFSINESVDTGQPIVAAPVVVHAVAASAPPPAPLASPPPAPMNATIQAPLLPTAPVESSGPAINRDPIFGAEIHWYTGLIWCSFLLLYSGLLLFIPAYAVGGSASHGRVLRFHEHLFGALRT